MTTPIYELGDLVTVRKGKKAVEVSEGPSEGFLRYIQIEDLRNNDSMKYARNPKGPICDENDVLIAWDGAKAGTVGFGLSGLVGSTIAILRPNESVYAPYLGMVLQSKYQMIRDACTGATIPHVSKPFLTRMKIPLPSISEQERIAAILDKANEIKKSINNVTEVREQLMLSTFYEMFHSDSSLRSDWIAMNIEELAVQRKNSMRTGPFGSNLLHSEFVDEGIPVLGIDNVVDNVFKWKKERYITEEKYRSLERYTVFPGDLLITIMGTVGRTAVCPDDLPVCINTKHLACITLNRELVHPFFVSYSLRHDQEILMQIQLKNRGAIMDGLNLTLIKSLKLAVPPIKLQHQFVEIMNRILDLDEQIECAENTTLSLTQELLT